MAAIQFPNNPSAGDLFVAGNGIRYTYDGEKWKTLGTSTVGTEGQFLESPKVLTINKVVAANSNTGAVGDLEISSGVVLTIPSTSTFRTLLGKSGGGSSNSLSTTGGTMTGFVTLNADPTLDLHAAPKQYVDTKAAITQLSDFAYDQTPGGDPEPITDNQVLVYNLTRSKWEPGEVVLNIGGLPTLP